MSTINSKRFCSSTSRTGVLPIVSDDRNEVFVIDSYPIQDTSSPALLGLQITEGIKFDYTITSNEVEQPEEYTNSDCVYLDDLSDSEPKSKLSKTMFKRISLDSLEEIIYQPLVNRSPEVLSAEKKLEEQRLRQQKETEEKKVKLQQQIKKEVDEYILILMELQELVTRMQQRQLL